MSDPAASLSEIDGRAALEELGEHLRQLRVSREWTLSTLQKRTGLGLKALSAYERGYRQPSLEVLRTICAAYDLYVSDFLSGVYPYGNARPPS